jgi:hypothetical protein
MRIPLIILLFFSCFLASAQNSANPGNITIHDASVRDILNKHKEFNEDISGFQGYRIQIFFASGNNAKNQALEKKSEFSTKYPDMDSHLIYQSPFFKVRVGDYRTKSEAYKFLKEISEDFPGAFIVEDLIDFPKLK